MIWASTTTGVALVLLALRDIFHSLWHPGGFGTLARLAFVFAWRASRICSRSPQGSELGGPLGLLLTLAIWSLLLAGGFALIYLPRMPADFNYASSLDVGSSSGLLPALYVSIVALTTLGLGDVQPASATLRLVLPLEALLGFLLLTAGISWILQLYPALIRRRALARHLTTLRRTDAAGRVSKGDAGAALSHLHSVREELSHAEMDLVQYGESYYFREASGDLSLAASLPYAASLAEAGRQSSSAAVRHAAEMLTEQLHRFLEQLRDHHLGQVGDEARTLVAFARDHGHRPRG